MCSAREGARLPYINTRNTARDMDVIRGILGERKISYIGWSYGTQIGAVYTQLFPGRSDRMVLDSAVDPTASDGTRTGPWPSAPSPRSGTGAD